MGRVSAAAPLDRVAPSEIPLTPELRFARTPGMRDQSTREAMAEHTPRATADALLYAMLDARSVELELLDGLTDSQMLGTPRHFVEPPIWEMGHVGWFQELWILRHLDGSPSLLPGSDSIYDSFNVSYTRRWEHEYPARNGALDYISEVLQRCVGRLEAREPTADDAYFYTLAALHEDMHAENLTLIRQTLGYSLPTLSHFDPACACPPVDPDWRLHDVTVPGGTFRLGAERDEPFVFDNEKWAHPVEVRPFRVASPPAPNGGSPGATTPRRRAAPTSITGPAARSTSGPYPPAIAPSAAVR